MSANGRNTERKKKRQMVGMNETVRGSCERREREIPETNEDVSKGKGRTGSGREMG